MKQQKFSVQGIKRAQIGSASFESETSSGARMLWLAASSTAPCYTFVGDQDTGVGRAGVDKLSLIAGGVEAARFVENAGWGVSMHIPEITTPT